MNYDQVIEKLKQVEETIDIILLTMHGDAGASVALYPEIDKIVARAKKRRIMRDQEKAAQKEYWSLKQRIVELETDYPQLKG